MKESGNMSPEVLETEYWDGHTDKDKCEWKMFPDFETKQYDYLRANEVGAEILRHFLSLHSQSPIKHFQPREPFTVREYKPETIIRYRAESLVIGEVIDNPYNRDEFWGVVCELDKSKKFLVNYWTQFSNDTEVLPGFVTNHQIIPDVAEHRRCRNGYKYPDVLFKVSNLTLYSGGLTVPERRKIRMPDWGFAFQRPKPTTV